jgi:hypothetical protein
LNQGACTSTYSGSCRNLYWYMYWYMYQVGLLGYCLHIMPLEHLNFVESISNKVLNYYSIWTPPKMELRCKCKGGGGGGEGEGGPRYNEVQLYKLQYPRYFNLNQKARTELRVSPISDQCHLCSMWLLVLVVSKSRKFANSEFQDYMLLCITAKANICRWLTVLESDLYVNKESKAFWGCR